MRLRIRLLRFAAVELNKCRVELDKLGFDSIKSFSIWIGLWRFGLRHVRLGFFNDIGLHKENG